MEAPLNWQIITHPINWVTILLMLIIGGIFGHLLLSLWGQEPATGKSNSPAPGYNKQPQQA